MMLSTTKRPTVAAMEEILGDAHPVLDHGFVRVVDYMGDDAAIVQAARVSYGSGTKSVREDTGLIRYLMRHWHSTPFEMCLGGDVRVPTYPAPGAAVKHYTMRQIAEAFEQGGKSNSWVKLLKIRTVNPETGVVSATKIKKAWKTGREKVYRVTTEAPFCRSIVLTANHPILTPTGFRKLEDGLGIGDKIMLNGLPALPTDLASEIRRRREAGQSLASVSSALGIALSTVYKYSKFRVKRKTGYFRKGQGEHRDPRAITRRLYSIGQCQVETCGKPASDRHHIDGNPQNNAPENISPLCSKHHRHMHTRSVILKAAPCKIASVEELGVQDVYDLEVADNNHTFVAEGVVVHNCELKLHVKLPIFIARQWIRHRTANVNEYSARYSVLDREFYLPPAEDLAAQSRSNRQGRGEILSPEESARVLSLLKSDAEQVYQHYEEMLNENTAGETLDPSRTGLARELARMNLSLNFYTQWYWKIDLHNLFHFLQLRADSHAQKEIRVYAEVLLDVVQKWVPTAAAAFEEYRLHAVHLSRTEWKVIQALHEGRDVTLKDSGLSEREWNTLMDRLYRTEEA